MRHDAEDLRKPMLIGIAGGSGSGKTTLARRIGEAFPESVIRIGYDNYYRDQKGLSFDERRRINYDHPDALETDLLIEHLTALKNGCPVEMPTYDFEQHTRRAETKHIEPRPVLIVDGILALADPRLRDLYNLKIYVDSDADVRILRRAARDLAERGRSMEDIIQQYLTSVKPMHARYVEPTRAYADLIVNGGQGRTSFEVIAGAIRHHLLLKQIHEAPASSMEKADLIASLAHMGQTDRAGVEYINHPRTVASYVETEAEQTVALLHDVLEDTLIPEDDIRCVFGDEIADGVVDMTHYPGDTYWEYLEKMKDNPVAVAVKFADLKHNMDFSRYEHLTEEDYERLERYQSYKKWLEEHAGQ